MASMKKMKKKKMRKRKMIMQKKIMIYWRKIKPQEVKKRNIVPEVQSYLIRMKNV